ncbi:50S ribosomal protein 5, chloroplastic [Mercurialis annua]|uniref:50S ribosomal protein 5, chloroplastic n=1 Tax=Mercurialis annua TaxID=3986 RepID=UPI002160A73B|nr:50S ribosomal protein 5, chloroplastic [Mercurialis annua]
MSLHLSPFVFTPSSSSFTMLTPVARLPLRGIDWKARLNCYGIGFRNHIIRGQRDAIIANASLDVDGTAPPTEVPAEEKPVAVGKLPLESKLQERAEQKLKMKLAKKIRLRRKRLVQKRRLRKKGRWPPSKMKKLKNV